MWKITKQTTHAARVSGRRLGERKISRNAHRLQQPGEGGAKTATTPPPPPPSSGRSRSVVKVLGGGLVIAAGAVGGSIAYAKANPEFRQQVESNWPILLPITSYIFDEMKPAETPQLGGIAPVRKEEQILPISEVKPLKKSEEKKSQKTITSSSTPPSVTKETGKDVKTVEKKSPEVSQTQKRNEEEEKKKIEEKRAKEMEQKLIEQEIDEAAEIAALEAILDRVMETAVDTTASAIQSQTTALKVIKEHNEKLKIALDNSEDVSTDEKDKQWNDVIEAAEVKRGALQVTEEEVLKAREEMEKLKSVIEEGSKIKSKYGPNKHLLGAKETLIQIERDLEEAERATSKADREAKMLKDCHELIEKSRAQFKKELASVVPEVKLGQRGAKLSQDELNAIIAYTHRRIEQLHKQLAEQQAMEEKRIAIALEKQKEKDEEMNKEEVERELQRKSAEWAILQEKKMSDLRKEYEDEMRVQLRRQAAAHSDHLGDVLRVQEKQHAAQMERLEISTRQQERDRYQEKLNGAMAKLRGVEAAIEGRADLEKQNKKSQELWLACETLKQTIATGRLGGRNWEDKLKPLANEVIAIKEVAGPDNQFVNTILEKVPEEALMRGVFNEDSLRERWDTVQRRCKRVALMDENGGSIFRYFVSYFQSLLVFTDSIPPLEDEEIDVSSLDVFKLVAYTTYYVEKGDFEQALRYANQLEGMPKKVASDWLKEVRLLLETSQVASVLSSQASASGLGGLHIQ